MYDTRTVALRCAIQKVAQIILTESILASLNAKAQCNAEQVLCCLHCEPCFSMLVLQNLIILMLYDNNVSYDNNDGRHAYMY